MSSIYFIMGVIDYMEEWIHRRERGVFFFFRREWRMESREWEFRIWKLGVGVDAEVVAHRSLSARQAVVDG